MNGHRMNMGRKETSMYVLKLESKFLSNQEKRMSKILITGEILVRYFAVRPLLPATWHHSHDEWRLINTIWKAKTGEALGTRLVSSACHSLSSLYSTWHVQCMLEHMVYLLYTQILSVSWYTHWHTAWLHGKWPIAFRGVPWELCERDSLILSTISSEYTW